MKTRIHLVNTLAVIVASMIVSCNGTTQHSSQGANIQYKTYMSHNREYEVEIPKNYSELKAAEDFMAFTHEGTQTLVTIQALPQSLSLWSFANSLNENSDFYYSVKEQTDTSLYCSVRSKSAIFNAYEFYQTKSLDGVVYVISVTSAELSSDETKRLITHIQNSLSVHSQKLDIIDNIDENDIAADDFRTRITKYYSISYPKEWKMVLNPDQMTDVYLGDAEGKLGCTIVFFDTDYTLEEISEESNASMMSINYRITENNQMNVNGNRCCKVVYESVYEGADIKMVSYTFKKGNTMYNVKFGTDRKYVDDNAGIIEKVIRTFKIM